MSFKPSENEEWYFALLEIERRRAAEERRSNASRHPAEAGPGGNGSGLRGPAAAGGGDRSGA